MAYSITAQLVAWLSAQGYQASTYPRANQEPPFVTVERTGGFVTDLVDHPSIAIQAWAETAVEAEQIALQIRDALLLESRPYGVYRVDVNAGPYPFYDESTRCPRYQIALDFTTQLTD